VFNVAQSYQPFPDISTIFEVEVSDAANLITWRINNRTPKDFSHSIPPSVLFKRVIARRLG
jgi:hypothetical protein